LEHYNCPDSAHHFPVRKKSGASRAVAVVVDLAVGAFGFAADVDSVVDVDALLASVATLSSQDGFDAGVDVVDGDLAAGFVPLYNVPTTSPR
jgi:hypothetical protein